MQSILCVLVVVLLSRPNDGHSLPFDSAGPDVGHPKRRIVPHRALQPQELITNGYYDLVTPYFGTRLLISQFDRRSPWGQEVASNAPAYRINGVQ
jgi:hypothetical protein